MANRAWNYQAWTLAKAFRVIAATILFKTVTGTIQPFLQSYSPSQNQTGNTGPGIGTWQNAPVGTTQPYSGGYQGALKVVRTADGDYTLVLQNNYQQLIGSSLTWLVPKSGGNIVAPGAPEAFLVLDGMNLGAAGGALIEIATMKSSNAGATFAGSSSPVTGATDEITGATGTTSGHVTTLSAGTSTVAGGYGVNALRGSLVSDGTVTAVVESNTAIVASGGAISGGTITTSVPLSATITASLVVTQQSVTPAGTISGGASSLALAAPNNNDELQVVLFFNDSTTV